MENVRLSGLPIVAPANPSAAGATGVLRITLKCASPEATFTQLGVDRLRFFLRGPTNQALALYELLGAHAISIAYADSAVDPAPVIVPASAIEPVGFSPDEALLPWSARGFSGFRLLTEYFAFPEKFLFLDFTRMDTKTLVSGRQPAGGLRLPGPLAAGTGTHHRPAVAGARLHAAGQPVSRSAASRSRSATRTPNTASCPTPAAPRAAEVWSVERVRETLPDGSFRPWRPFHRLTEGDPEAGVPGGFYHVARRAAAPGVPGTEVFLAPHDPDFDPDRPAEAVLSIDALCVNRDLPTDLPFGGGHPRLRLVEGAAAVAALNAVTAATPTLRPPLREAGFWRLVSHLSLGHLSVTGGPEGAAALKEVLRLYDLRDTAETRAAIEALTGISAGPGHCPRARPRRRLLPRPRCHAGIRSPHLAGRRPLSARRGAGALPRAARHGQQLHPHPRHPARPPRHCRRLARPQRHPRAAHERTLRAGHGWGRSRGGSASMRRCAC